MHKKIIMAASVFLFCLGAYLVLSRGDRADRPRQPADATEAVRRFVSLPASQPVHSITEAGLSFSPGDRTQVRVYDEVTGRLRYQFEAQRWEPLETDMDFHVEDLLIRIFMPGGEITYISADRADVTLARRSRNRIEVQRGVLNGHVRVVIDRTTTEWREAHPDLASRDRHVEALITITMDNARFDLDRAELRAPGSVVVDGREARIEDVRGLTVQWDQTDNRVERLLFEDGGRMIVRRSVDLVDFTLPGSERTKRPPIPSSRSRPSPSAGGAPPFFEVPRARANEPMSISAVTAEEAAAEIRLEGGRVAANRPKSLVESPTSPPSRNGPTPDTLRTPEALAADTEAMTREARGARPPTDSGEADGRPDPVGRREKKVDTYRALFKKDVLVEQFEGDRVVGTLEADELEVHFDFGRQQRRAMSASPEPDADEAAGQTTPPDPRAPGSAADLTDGPTTAPDRDRLVLIWNGPLVLRPIEADPVSRTGRRFDVIATGRPVKIRSEQGRSTCRRLVFRNERRQIWLSGPNEAPVELTVSDARKLVAPEVFFDQKRGLAHIEGAGFMVDSRDPVNPPDTPAAKIATFDGGLRAGTSGDRRACPVEIRWSRAVDLELTTRTLERIDPDTGLRRPTEREFLRRAWFHGDVSFQQGSEHLTANDVAATFGVPRSDGAVADYIEHLNMKGNVRLQREGEHIEAQRLDVDLVLAPDGRNVPRTVAAEGDVLAKQDRREIRADTMYVRLGRYPGETKLGPDGKTRIVGRSRLGIESLDADGNVFVQDPEHNMKVSRAESLKAAIRNGSELVRATILSPRESVFARARYEEMAVHGHRIEIDMDRQSIDVPGPGKSWMVTREDFGGRRLKKPTPVKTTWSKRMQLRMGRNYGVFVGDVRSTSPEFALKCDKLTVRFARVPPIQKKKDTDFLDRFAVLGAITKDKAEIRVSGPVAEAAERKRPTYVVAEGRAEAVSSRHAPPSSPNDKGRLISRLHVAGEQIVADLAREQMSVPFAGTLLIEDYQFDASGIAARNWRSGGGGGAGGPLMSSLRSAGPSQTLLTWKNSMDFFVDRGLVIFDKDVRMVHRSGREMVQQETLAETMGLSPVDLRQMLGSGRLATLTCGNLLLEFRRGRSSDPAGIDVGRATDLDRLIARRAVHLQEGAKSLMGEYLQYLRETDEVRVEGSKALLARIVDQDELSQRLNMWRGPLLIWNRRTNYIETFQADIRTNSR